ncbi:hypothetical protein COLO4_22328 [Corchorus olitorius]|uniref:Uncharacterized protein n=1 Tax=Corchorus olitorius TaxID=93759 RepID=A0A1R3IMU8_9ROSI|nr:hypothetical protein COLO4_22328 [Corchorus olitorius]
MAIDSTKATLAVKRRLACEMVKYWQQCMRCGFGLPTISHLPNVPGARRLLQLPAGGGD